MVDVIARKQLGKPLAEEEISFFVRGAVDGSIPDYQISALLMAIYFCGMDSRETTLLTQYMADSGDIVDLSAVDGVKADKHSTGGVGDKTTLVVAPVAAACGVKVAKMSGRGLGFTGGTLDKLESIPGFKTRLSQKDFLRIVNDVGVCVIGQSGNICPADKKLYAIRDVTGTVRSIPLIASSIMSKKLAAGADCILLDVKMGSGAFMKKEEDAVALAEAMVDIGRAHGKKTAALITNMDAPLGCAVGNALEVAEAVDTLKGGGPDDFRTLCLEISAHMLQLAGRGDGSECKKMAEAALKNGRGLDVFMRMVSAQGGDAGVIKDTSLLPKAAVVRDAVAGRDGFIARMDAEQCGVAAGMLGAGREMLDSRIDHAAGIMLLKKPGDAVRKGEAIAKLHTSDESRITRAQAAFLGGIEYSESKLERMPLILKEA
jgi:pyrimidine-nucleoside phosphorylase